MGSCFLYITKEKPEYGWAYDRLKEASIRQGYGSALDHMWRCLPKHLRDKYPMLGKVDFQSGCYYDEVLNLTPQEVKSLREEFEKLLNVLNYQDFEPGLDAAQFNQYLQSGHYGFESGYFEEQRKDTFELLKYAESENCWIRISR
jgi:hypothetical protein